MPAPHPHDTETPQPWFEWRRFLIGLIEAAAALALLASALGFFGGFHWFLDLFSHFRAQYAAALVGAALVAVASRRLWSSALWSVGAAANLAVLAPLMLPAARATSSGAPAPPRAPLRLATVNVLYRNPDPSPTLAWLRSSPSDMVFLCEVTRQWADALRDLRDVYPHQDFRPQQDPFGAAVLSRIPWQHAEWRSFGTFDAAGLVLRFEWHGRDSVLIGLHPPPPNSRSASAHRDAALREAGDFLASHPAGTRILVGDLNATPWSHTFRHLLATTGLVDTARGRGWQPTWNVRSPVFQIPIDHVLASPDVAVTGRSIGPDLGSDHRAVLVTLEF